MKNSTSGLNLNPFAMMVDPERVLREVERSSALNGLRLRKYRPLDRPWIPLVSKELSDSDAAIDREIEGWPELDHASDDIVDLADRIVQGEPTSWPALDLAGHN